MEAFEIRQLNISASGYAFAETSLTDRLTEKGVTFRTVVQDIK